MYVKSSERTALIFGDDRISYAELSGRIRSLSRVLAAGAGERVIIFAENRPEWVTAFFAAWCRGAVNVPVDMFSGTDELAYVIKDCRPVLIVHSARTAETARAAAIASASSAAFLDFDAGLPPADSAALPGDPDHQFGDSELALLLYTSGTTGGAKGVMLSWKNLMTNIRWVNDARRVNESDRMLAVLPFHHSWPLMGSVLCPLECGATVVLLKVLNGEELVKALKGNRITKLVGVPRLYEIIHKSLIAKIKARKPAWALFKLFRVFHWKPLCRIIFGAVHREFGGAIEVFLSGGARTDPAIIKDFRALGIAYIEGYGLTETAPMVTYHPYDDQHIGTVGKIYEDMEWQVTDDGELLLRGPNLMLGYWERPEESAAALEGGWFHTGDLVHIDRHGWLTITGRKKDIIVLANGKNVRPDLIEDEILREFPLVKEIAVTQKQDRLFAIVKPNLEHARLERITNLADSVKWSVIDMYNKLAKSYNRIHDFMITTEDLPRTRMGKLKRFLLPAFIHKPPTPRAEDPVPDSEEYALIAENIAWQTDRRVRPSDHLEMDLGMDSLALTELQVFIEKGFGVRLEEGWTNTWPTVADLAAHVAAAKTQSEASRFDWGAILREPVEPMPEGKGGLMRLLYGAYRLLFAGRVKVRSRGAELLPRGACIITPNHQSFFDSLFLLGALPHRARPSLSFLAKRKHFAHPLARVFARDANVVVMDINKNIVESVLLIASALKAGRKVVIFPEGTRTRSGRMAAFKKTFAIIAAELDVPVVPVAVRGAWNVLPPRSFIPRRGTVEVEFLPPVRAEGRSPAELAQAVQDLVAAKVAAAPENAPA